MSSKTPRKTLTLFHPWHGERRLGIDEIARISTKSRRTIRHWINHPETIDSDSLKLLELYTFGLLPDPAAEWEGFYFSQGELRNAKQPRFYLKASELGSYFLTVQLNHSLQYEVEQLRQRKAKPARKLAQVLHFSDYAKRSKPKLA